MTAEILFVLIIGLCAVWLFVTEKLRVDVVALLVMSSFIASGVLTVEEGIAGFSNPATVTVGTMFILAAGIQYTGAMERVASFILRTAGKSLYPTVAVLMLTIGFLSAFVNNTAAVAVFLPITLEIARRSKNPASKLLIPLSFASLFGGACTLIGTSTNILVSSLSVNYGGQPIGMFELAPLGLILSAVGLTYMLLIGIRVLPERSRPEVLTESFEMNPYLVEFCIKQESELSGLIVGESALSESEGIEVLEIEQNQEAEPNPSQDRRLSAGARIRALCTKEAILTLHRRGDLDFNENLDELGKMASLVEAVVAPGSPLVDKSLNSLRFEEERNLTVLAIKRHGKLSHTKLHDVILKVGDVLLLNASPTSVDEMQRNQSFVMVSNLNLPKRRKKLLPVALTTLAVVVLLSAFGLFPILVAALLGSAVLIVTGCVTADEAYESIDWKVIMLLGGMLTLGKAMTKSGAAQLLADQVVALAGPLGPWIVLGLFYLLTSILTEALSNNATAVLLVPIAFSTAQKMGVDPRPFLIAITFAASSSFMTPVGYQTNTLVYGPGHYRFKDFLKVGTPLNVLFWVTATALIPHFWPFYPKG